jgi:hypothetical protein
MTFRQHWRKSGTFQGRQRDAILLIAPVHQWPPDLRAFNSIHKLCDREVVQRVRPLFAVVDRTCLASWRLSGIASSKSATRRATGPIARVSARVLASTPCFGRIELTGFRRHHPVSAECATAGILEPACAQRWGPMPRREIRSRNKIYATTPPWQLDASPCPMRVSVG